MTTDTPAGYEAFDGSSNKIFKKILKEGTGEQPTRAGSTVKVHYTGKLLDGTVFDSSVPRNDLFSFRIGKSQVIKGWDVGVATMKIGEKAEFYILPEYGYGKQGSPPKIPGDSVLIFEVELFGIDLSTADMTVQEKIQAAHQAKDEGNTAFKTGDIQKALTAYVSASGFLSNLQTSDPTQEEEIKNLRVSVDSNLAACHLKVKDGRSAVDCCKEVLALEPNHPKALYRLFQGQVLLGQFEEAVAFLESKKDLLGESVNVAQEIVKVKKLKIDQTKKEKDMYSRMFA
jgi:FKBP-type peptidyl-prolyl cis-trans isomerase